MSSDMQVCNIVSGSATGTGWAAYGDATLQTGDVISVTTSDTNPDAVNAIMTPPFPATSGKPYMLTADIKATANFSMISGRGSTGMVSLSVGIISITSFELTTDWSHVSVELTPSKDASDAMVTFLAASSDGSPASLYVRDLMLVEGTTPAAWAPAEGETISGVGALTSDNLLEGLTPNLSHGASATDGGWQLAAYGGPDHHQDQVVWDLAGQSAVDSNQTMTASFALRGDAAMDGALNVTIGYKDSAGNINWCGSQVDVSTGWGHAFATLVVPAGMTPYRLYLSPTNGSPAMQVANVSLRFGGRQTLASACHTPYVTDSHLRAEYATQASLNSYKTTNDQAVAAAKKAGTDAQATANTANTNANTALTTANNAVTTANGAKSTADATAALIRSYAGGALVAKTGTKVGALVNANGSFDVVSLAWTNNTPNVSSTLFSLDADSATEWQVFEVTLNESSNLLTDSHVTCMVNPGLGLAYLSIDMTFESPGWQPGTGTWLFRLPEILRPSGTVRLYNLLQINIIKRLQQSQIFINERRSAHVDVHSDGYCYPTYDWQATNIMCNVTFPTAELKEYLQ